MEKTFDASRLDVEAFAQAGAVLQGQRPLSTWSRLHEEQWLAHALAHAHEHETVQWRIQGRMLDTTGDTPQVALQLHAQTQLVLQCQRCLTAVVQPVNVAHSYVFVADEATAAALDETSDEDVLALSQELDALTLIEDELMLALPLVACHDICPEPLPSGSTQASTAAELDDRPHPFAALAALKKKTMPPGSP